MTSAGTIRHLPAILSFVATGIGGCSSDSPSVDTGGENGAATALHVVAESPAQWTGVAVSRANRLFVNYPRWRSGLVRSVAEIGDDGAARSYPTESWNSWTDGDTDVHNKFVCVQSVYIDDQNSLWVLDTGNPYLRGVRPGAPKLVNIDLSRDSVGRIYSFDSTMVSGQRYLNDVRVDTRDRVAYISESGMGAIIVVDLAAGSSRLVLDRHLSTTAEPITFTIEGMSVTYSIDCDGIALTKDRINLYFKPLSGSELFRIETRHLRDTTLADAVLGGRVEFVADVGICDGLEFGYDGSLYITSLEENAIKRLTPAMSLDTVVQNSLIRWPDSIFITEDNMLYFTTSQIHLGANATDPYRVFRIRL